MRVQPGVQEGMRTFRVGFREVWLIDSRQEGEEWLRDRQNGKRSKWEGQGLGEGRSG